MNDVDMLLKACRTSRDDDAPRLALADRLRETGWDAAGDYVEAGVRLPHTAPDTAERGAIIHTLQAAIEGYAVWLESLGSWRVLPISKNGRSQNFRVVRVLATGDVTRSANMMMIRGLPERLFNCTLPFFMDRAVDLFRFPITEAITLDRTAVRGGPHYPENYCWHRAYWPQKFNTWEGEPSHLPAPIFDLLPRVDGMRPGHYASQLQCGAALGTAMLAYGNSLVSS